MPGTQLASGACRGPSADRGRPSIRTNSLLGMCSRTHPMPHARRMMMTRGYTGRRWCMLPVCLLRAWLGPVHSAARSALTMHAHGPLALQVSAGRA
eukprot:3939284-Rhodomonas_salina.1